MISVYLRKSVLDYTDNGTKSSAGGKKDQDTMLRMQSLQGLISLSGMAGRQNT